MKTIAELLKRKKTDVEQRKSQHTPDVPLDDRRLYWERNQFRIFAEIKRASLSVGAIRPGLDLDRLARSYEAAGAAAISVLTEEHFFQGSLDDLRQVRRAVSTPLLQKDFILDEFQILEAKEAGADFILLITRFLKPEQIREMQQLCEKIGMNAIVEVTDEKDLQKLDFPVRYIGVNSRDLETLQVDLSRFVRMRDLLPDAYCIAESGIDSVEVLRKVFSLGYNGALIGEHFLRSENPAEELSRFVRSASHTKVKICGITTERDARTSAELGASALGFIFAESPRRISVESLKSFRERIAVPCIGVFRNQSRQEIESTIAECALNIAQIYDSCSASIPTWHATTLTSLREIAEQTEASQGRLLDIKIPESDLPQAWELLSRKSLFALAGGLHAGNISQAISLCHPEWVDVARGVESEPGIKDGNKIREFIRLVNGK